MVLGLGHAKVGFCVFGTHKSGHLCMCGVGVGICIVCHCVCMVLGLGQSWGFAPRANPDPSENGSSLLKKIWMIHHHPPHISAVHSLTS